MTISEAHVKLASEPGAAGVAADPDVRERTTKPTHPIAALALAFALVAGACKNGEPPTQQQDASHNKTSPQKGPGEEEAPNFFDEDKVFADTKDPKAELDAVKCAGQGDGEGENNAFHKQKVRGTVWVPHGKFAARQPSHAPTWERVLDTLVGSRVAYAHPLPQERAIPDLEVRIYQVDAAGKPLGGPVLTTKTNFEGRYCFRLPDDVKVSPALVATVGEGDTQMRRNVVGRTTNDVFLQPEALIQVLIERKIDLTQLPRREFGNLYSLTDTIVDDRERPDPLDLPPDTNIKAGVALVKQRLLENERFNEKIGELAKEYPRE